MRKNANGILAMYNRCVGKRYKDVSVERHSNETARVKNEVAK